MSLKTVSSVCCCSWTLRILNRQRVFNCSNNKLIVSRSSLSLWLLLSSLKSVSWLTKSKIFFVSSSWQSKSRWQSVMTESRKPFDTMWTTDRLKKKEVRTVSFHQFGVNRNLQSGSLSFMLCRSQNVLSGTLLGKIFSNTLDRSWR